VDLVTSLNGNRWRRKLVVSLNDSSRFKEIEIEAGDAVECGEGMTSGQIRFPCQDFPQIKHRIPQIFEKCGTK